MKFLSWIPWFRPTADASKTAVGSKARMRRLQALRGSGATQVRDVLGRLVACRKEVKSWRDSLRTHVADGRTNLLLDYIGAHEEHIESCLARYSGDRADVLLDTWLPFGLDKADLDAIEQVLDLSPCMSVEDVVSLTLQVDRAMMELYSRLASAPRLPHRVRELFDALLELEQNKDRKVSFALLDA